MSNRVRQLNVRLPAELLDELETIAKEEQLDRTTVARRLLAKGVNDWRLEHAIRAYREGRVSKERAAEMAGVSLYRMMDELRVRGATAQYSLAELQEDIRLLIERAA